MPFVLYMGLSIGKVLGDPVVHMAFDPILVRLQLQTIFPNLFKGFLQISADCYSMLFVMECISIFLCSVSHLVLGRSVLSESSLAIRYDLSFSRCQASLLLVSLSISFPVLLVRLIGL